MNNSNPDSYLTPCGSVSAKQDGMPIGTSSAKKPAAGNNAAAAFQKSFKEVAADIKRDKQKIGLKELENSRIRQQEFMSILSRSSKTKKAADPLDTQRKCMAIARRIMKGAKVTLEELRYLLENDPQLYFMAMLFKQEKPQDNDEEVKLEDEESLEDEQLESFEKDSKSDVSVTGPDCSTGMSAGVGAGIGI